MTATSQLPWPLGCQSVEVRKSQKCGQNTCEEGAVKGVRDEIMADDLRERDGLIIN